MYKNYCALEIKLVKILIFRHNLLFTLKLKISLCLNVFFKYFQFFCKCLSFVCLKTMEQIMEQQLLSATEMIEQQVDAQLQQLDQMGEDDFDALRQRRLEGMKQAEQQRKEWKAAGHGNVRF